MGFSIRPASGKFRGMKPQWHENLILICEKCGKKLEEKSGSNPAHDLKDWLKKELKSRDLWGTTRVVNSTCLDICPEDKIAVAFVSDRPDLGNWAEVIRPGDEKSKILQIAIARTKPAPRAKN